MSTIESPSAIWDAMADQQRIAWLAKNVMGWTDGGTKMVRNGKMKGKLAELTKVQVWWMDCDNRGYYDVAPYFWNPLTDWNHTMEVAVLAFPPEKGHERSISVNYSSEGRKVLLYRANDDGVMESDNELSGMENLCEAICKAVFLALQP